MFILSFTGFYWIFLGFTRLYWVVLGFTVFDEVLLTYTGFYCFFLPSFIGLMELYPMALGFVEVVLDFD